MHPFKLCCNLNLKINHNFTSLAYRRKIYAHIQKIKKVFEHAAKQIKTVEVYQSSKQMKKRQISLKKNLKRGLKGREKMKNKQQDL